MDAAEPSYEGLRDAAVAGVRWIAIARVIGESAQLISAVVLARLIAPAEFGHAAIALILVPLAAILTFEGFGSALVQRKEIDQGHLETAMLASLIAGLALSVATYLTAPPIAAPLFGDRTAGLIQLASPLFLVAGFSAVSRSLLWRELEFRNVSLIETGAVAFGASVAVGLAVAGLEGEAIVLGAVAGGIVASCARSPASARLPPVPACCTWRSPTSTTPSWRRD
jgi:PST family polysaccharide transporter